MWRRDGISRTRASSRCCMLLVRRRSRGPRRPRASGWKGRIHLPCHMGNHGPQLRTIWGSGSVLFVQDTKLHEDLRGRSRPELRPGRQEASPDVRGRCRYSQWSSFLKGGRLVRPAGARRASLPKRPCGVATAAVAADASARGRVGGARRHLGRARRRGPRRRAFVASASGEAGGAAVAPASGEAGARRGAAAARRPRGAAHGLGGRRRRLGGRLGRRRLGGLGRGLGRRGDRRRRIGGERPLHAEPLARLEPDLAEQVHQIARAVRLQDRV